MVALAPGFRRNREDAKEIAVSGVEPDVSESDRDSIVDGAVEVSVMVAAL